MDLELKDMDMDLIIQDTTNKARFVKPRQHKTTRVYNTGT